MRIASTIVYDVCTPVANSTDLHDSQSHKASMKLDTMCRMIDSQKCKVYIDTITTFTDLAAIECTAERAT